MKKLSFLLSLAIVICFTTRVNAQTLNLWSVDALDKIFTDSEPIDSPVIELSAASNEYESAQFAVRSDSDVDVQLVASSLVCEATGASIDVSNVRLRPIGFIPIVHNTPSTEGIFIRKAPCDIPEVLLESNQLELKANASQGVWVTVCVPKGTAPGIYQGGATLKGASGEWSIPITLEVFSFELPDERNLYHTNWWFPNKIVDFTPAQEKIKIYSETYWALIESYFKNMGEHRQNVILVSWIPGPDELFQAKIDKNGEWVFDFSRLERQLALAEKYGVSDRIELSHIGGINRENHMVNLNQAAILDETIGQVRISNFDEWFEPCFKGLCDYLRSTGRFEKTMLHIADEPYLEDVESWREVAARVKQIEPEIKLIDAIEAINFSDLLDVWVPKLSHYHRWQKAFEARRANNEFWFYICCHPYGSNYPNRFMDLPGVRIRSIFWVNYVENMTGYLHWGYNYWLEDAFGAPSQLWGPGDGHIVYPGPNGPLDSIRWELQRESAEDYEYLKLLEKNIAKVKSEYPNEKVWAFDAQSRSMELARRVAPDMIHTTLDNTTLEDARRAIANDIVQTNNKLRLIVQTFPEDGATVYAGPIIGELYGITTPGAIVTVAGDPVKVSDDGLFSYQMYLRDSQDTPIEVVATLDGETVKTQRIFHIGAALAK